jgi:hypothetical protein
VDFAVAASGNGSWDWVITLAVVASAVWWTARLHKANVEKWLTLPVGTRVRITSTTSGLYGRTGTIVDYAGIWAEVQLDQTESGGNNFQSVQPRHLQKIG